MMNVTKKKIKIIVPTFHDIHGKSADDSSLLFSSPPPGDGDANRLGDTANCFNASLLLLLFSWISFVHGS